MSSLATDARSAGLESQNGSNCCVNVPVEFVTVSYALSEDSQVPSGKNCKLLVPEELSATRVWSDGTFTTGGVVSVPCSTTVTVKLAVPGFPAASVAVQVTVVAPTEKNEPDTGVQVRSVTPMLSVAVCVKYTFCPVEFVVELVMFVTVTTGGIVSLASTLTLNKCKSRRDRKYQHYVVR